MEEDLIISRDTNVKIIKWKVKSGSQIYRGSVLALYKANGDDKILKFKAGRVGTVKELCVKEDAVADPGQAVVKIEGCTHATVMKKMCAECGADLSQELEERSKAKSDSTTASVAMVHSVPELIVSEQLAKELGRADENRLLKNRKLVLLVDLDQTLIHTTNDNIPPNLKGVYHFQLPHGNRQMWFHTKFRPHTKKFLSKMSQLYELHICTFGVRLYAHTIARFLDPEGKYFSHRILSRDEFFNPSSKTANLKALFPCGDSMACIIDDREDVWNYAPNLVHVKPYLFFEGTADINAPPGLNKGDKESEESKTSCRVVKVHRVRKNRNKDDEAEECPEKEDQKKETESKAEVVETTKQATNGSPENRTPTVTEMVEKMEDLEATQTKEGNLPESQRKVDELEKKVDESEKTVVEVEKKVVDSEKVAESEKKVDESEKVDELEKMDESEKKVVEANEKKENESSSDGSGDKAEVQSEKPVITDPTKPESEQGDGTNENCSKPEDLTMEEDEISSKDSRQTSQVVDEGDTKQTSNVVDEEFEELIEWDDNDDYLHYLEDVLRKIHSAFYEVHDQLQTKAAKDKDMPDLKSIIPYVKKKVLKGTNLVFSGVFPTNQSVEKSRAYNTAKSLGATIQTVFVPPGEADSTTHLVAAKLGTAKVNSVRKHKTVHVLTPEWLWCCAERWEWVDERLFPLTERSQSAHGGGSPDLQQMSKKRKRDDHSKTKRSNVDSSSNAENLDTTKSDPISQPSTSSPPTSGKIEQRRFSETVSPMYALSKDDWDSMGKEVEDLLESDEAESDSSQNSSEKEKNLRKQVLGQTPPESSSDDSMSGEYPRGWKRKKRKREDDDNVNVDGEEPPLVSLFENPNQLGVFSEQSSDSDRDDDDFDESVGSADEEMAAALEKEFLS